MFAPRLAFVLRWACLCALGLFATPSYAADPLPAAPTPSNGTRGEWEALVAYWNDYPFVSDGAGPTGSIEIAIRRGTVFGGIGLFGVSPELRLPGDFRAVDPLPEQGRLVAWLGKHETRSAPSLGGIALPTGSRVDRSIALRLGGEGGAIDGLAEDARDAVHTMMGSNIRPLYSTHDLRAVFGVSGHARLAVPIAHIGSARLLAAPFAYGSLGTDVVEGAGGLMLAMQPLGEPKLPFLTHSGTGAHAPMFGGDGIGLFANMRAIAHDSLYAGLEEPWVFEGGITAQVTFGGRLRLGAAASCSTDLYERAPKGSCIAAMRAGVRF